jgi:hypothetical protein
MNFRSAAEECANYIFDSDSEQISYQEYIEEGNDPRDHILYCAAVVLGKEQEEFNNDIKEFIKSINESEKYDQTNYS